MKRLRRLLHVSKGIRDTATPLHANEAVNVHVQTDIRPAQQQTQPGGLGQKIVKSAGRAFAVLNHFDEIQRPATSVEVATALDMPTSSASILLRSIVALGYLSYEQKTRTYLPTLRVALLGDWLRGPPSGGRRLLQALDLLKDATGEAVTLAMRNGINSQCVYSIAAANANWEPPSQGSCMPLTHSSSGWMLLSMLPRGHALRTLTHLNAQYPERAVSPADALERLKAIERDECVYWNGEAQGSPARFAMPWHYTRETIPIVLEISAGQAAWPKQREAILQMVQRTRIKVFGS